MRKIRLNESQFNRLVLKCVKKALNEDLEQDGIETYVFGPNILRDMADYLEGCDKSEYQYYMDDIVNSGLFHDACGEVVNINSLKIDCNIDY